MTKVLENNINQQGIKKTPLAGILTLPLKYLKHNKHTNHFLYEQEK